jgi:hypothetical protein
MKRRAKRAAVPSNNRRRGRSKKLGETRMKFFDTISDDENEDSRGTFFYETNKDLEDEEFESFKNSSCEKIDSKTNKFLKKKRRLKKTTLSQEIDPSKILSEIKIDSGNLPSINLF